MPLLKNLLLHKRLEAASAIVFLLFATLFILHGRDDNSPWSQSTRPLLAVTGSNTLMGFTTTLDGAPFFNENIPFVKQISFFDGHLSGGDVYLKRSLYSFLAYHITPLFGVLGALLILNIAAYAFAVYLTWRFAWILFIDKITCLIATFFISSGLGFAVHVGDYSAHLLSYSLYFYCVLVLYESKVWAEYQPLRSHLLIGSALGVLYFSYNYGLILLIAYIILSFKHNRILHLLAAALLAALPQVYWKTVFSLANINDVESAYFGDAIYRWAAIYQEQGLSGIIYTCLKILVELATFDSPALVLSGIVGLFYLGFKDPRTKFIFFISAVTVGMIFVWLTYAQARGYLIYPLTLFCAVAAANLFRQMIAARQALIKAAAIGLCALLALAHISWNTAHLRSQWGPVNAYIWGIFIAQPFFTFSPPSITKSITGNEPTPRYFNGQSTLAEAGAYVEAAETLHPRERHIAVAFLAKLFPYLYCIVFLTLVFPPSINSRYRYILLSVSLLLINMAYSVHTVSGMWPSVIKTDGYSLRQSSTGHYSIRPSASFVESLKKNFTPGDSLAFVLFSRTNPSPEVYYDCDGKPFSYLRTTQSGNYHIVENASESLNQLSLCSTFNIAILNRVDTQYDAWQKTNLVGRTFTIDGDPKKGISTISRLPAFEIRLLDYSSRPKIIGF